MLDGPKPLIVIPTYVEDDEALGLTARCIRSVAFHCTRSAEIMVVDDASPRQVDVERMVLNGLVTPRFHPKERNEGFARAVNVGISEAYDEGRDVILLNADVEVDYDIVPAFYHPADGDWHQPVQGGVLYFPGDPKMVQHAGVYFSVLRREFDHIHRYAPVGMGDLDEWRRCPVTAACMFISRDTVDVIGGFDEGFRMGWEDVDFCIRAFEAGHECWVNPGVEAVHHESVFRSKPSQQRAMWEIQSYRRLWQKHAGTDFSSYVPTMIGA